MRWYGIGRTPRSSVVEVLRGQRCAGLDRGGRRQPALFAVMVSLAAWWESHGVVPSAVVGHSQGEDRRSVWRAPDVGGGHPGSCLCAAWPWAGCRATGRWSRSPHLPRWSTAGWVDGLSVAAMNGPSSVVGLGSGNSCWRCRTGCEQAGIRAGSIDIDYASHSEQVEQGERPAPGTPVRGAVHRRHPAVVLHR